MTGPAYFLSYVEDEPSRHVVRRLFAHFRDVAKLPVEIVEGFPFVLGGFGKIRTKASKWADAARNGTWLFVVTDLDANESPNALCREWLGMDCLGLLPQRFVFRIAVREIESWIMADRTALAKFLRVPLAAIPDGADDVADPKAALLSIIRTKCTKKAFRDMLPVGNQRVGVAYNERLCAFIDERWSIDRARTCSPSLDRCIAHMVNLGAKRGFA